MRDRLTPNLGLSSCCRRAACALPNSNDEDSHNEHQQAAGRDVPGSGPGRLLEAGSCRTPLLRPTKPPPKPRLLPTRPPLLAPRPPTLPSRPLTPPPPLLTLRLTLLPRLALLPPTPLPAPLLTLPRLLKAPLRRPRTLLKKPRSNNFFLHAVLEKPLVRQRLFLLSKCARLSRCIATPSSQRHE